MILHSSGEKSALHPSRIKLDLEKNENVTCWCAGGSEEQQHDNIEIPTIDTMMLLIRNARLVIVCMSDYFAADQRCCELFTYVKLLYDTSRYMLVALGESFEWQKTEVGALVTHEFFIKINNLDRLVNFNINYLS